MRDDIPLAALHMLEQFPARRHDWQAPARNEQQKNNLRAIVVEGRHYESLTEAGRQLGKSRGAIRNMVAAGRARYA